jgi:beta-mannanase
MPTPKRRSVGFTIQLIFFASLVLIAFLLSAVDNSSAEAEKSTLKKQPATTMVSNVNNIPKEGTGLKFGMYIDAPSPQPYNALLGRQMNIMAWFVHWDDNILSNKLQTSCSEGYVPVITWESWNSTNSGNSYNLSDIAAGKYDSLIKNQLTEIKNTCKNQTVIIRFDHEMDTPVGITGWYPWQGNPTAYVQAWQHVVGISHQVDPNIKWLWAPNRGTPNSLLYYPGGKWVDYVGLTLNRGSLESQYSTFQDFYTQNQQIIESLNKPVIIGETTSDSKIYTDNAIWVTQMFEYAKSNPNITALIWFNGSSSEPSYSFKSNTATLNAFKVSLKQLGN